MALRDDSCPVDDRNGLVYIVDIGAHNVVVLDQHGTFLFKFGERGSEVGQFNFPSDIALDEEGNVYVLDSLNFRVQVFSPSGDFLREFGEQGMRLSEDMVAGVIGRLEGAMPGSLNIVLEPEEALVWAEIGNDANPLDTFVSLGSVLLEGIALALSEILGSESQFNGPALVEESELMMLVKTHAPSDTLVFSTRLQIDVRDEVVSAVSHLLIEPKYLRQLLSALSAAVH